MTKLSLILASLLLSLSASAYQCNEIAGQGMIEITSDPGAITLYDQNGASLTFSLRKRQLVTNDHELQTFTAKNKSTIRANLRDLNYQTDPGLIIISGRMFRCD